MKYSGENTIRPDGFDKVTGRAKYAADYYMSGMLHIALVRSAYAHAEILGIDTADAEKEALVFTAKDLKENVIVDIINDRPALACDKVRFFGEPIAVVAAETKEKAVRAASKVKVTYRELPHCIDCSDALKEDAVPIHDGGNLIGTFENVKGDPEKAFTESDLVIEHTFTTPFQEHAYMEPDAGFCYMDGDVLTLISASQNVFADKNMLVTALGIPEDKVRVKNAVLGGAFGGKDGHICQIYTALVTQKTGRPAKLVFEREESIAYTFKRHSTVMTVKMGFRKDGRILAYSLKADINTGAYVGYGFAVLGLLTEHAPGPYSIDNIELDSKLVYTNLTPASAFRGFGAPQSAFARESIVSEAAYKLGIDQIEIRKLNALHTGDTGSLGQTITTSCGIEEALDLLEKSPLWQERKTNKDKNVGYGIAAGHLSCGFGKGVPDAAEIEMKKTSDGRYEFFIGLTDLGQGNNNSLRAIAADRMQTDIDNIIITMSDTLNTFACGATAASRSTFIGGNAIIAAADEYLKREKAGEKDITVHIKVPFPETDRMHSIGAPHVMYTFIAQAVKLRVDPDTGKVSLLDAAAATEAGTVINPMQLDGQIQGGMVQSLGFALSENTLINEEGKIINDNFSTYILPAMSDIPGISSEYVKAYEESGPMGVKGAAEAPTVPTCGAVNSAVFDATGIWHYNLPITAESILLGEVTE